MKWLKDERFHYWKRWTMLLSKLMMIGIVLIGMSMGMLYLLTVFMGAPELQVPQTTIYYDHDETVISESNQDGQNRYWVDLEHISPNVIDATIAIEDRHFYDHMGFDFKRIGGAILADLKAMAKVQGASTITQQYARNLFLEHDKTWKRKIAEAFYAYRLEVHYSKEEILEGYLNTIYYGHGSYGIESAARTYFGKKAEELSLAEAAMLAGIPKGPGYYSPYADAERAEERQSTVLQAMVSNDVLSEAEAMQAETENMALQTFTEETKSDIAPYFAQEVKKELRSVLSLDERVIEQGGLHVYTTLDAQMQKAAEKWVASSIDQKSDIQAALVAMEPTSGAVKVMIGGRDYSESKFNRATMAKRTPGSTFKPLLYYAAIKNGFTPSTLVRSEPTTFYYDNEKKTYSPHNYGDVYANEEITLAQALALSDNVVAVKTHMFLEEKTLVNTAKSFGITSKLSAIPSLALGTKPVGMMEMTEAYSMLANGGYSVAPYYIEKVTDRDGKVIYEHSSQSELVLDPEAAFVTTSMMTGVFDESLNDYTRVTGSGIDHLLTRPAAAKTGSTSTDSWMVGFTPQLTAAVWVGYDKGETLNHRNDGSYTKKIWANFIEEALAEEEATDFKKPENVVGIEVDPQTGLIATDNCPVKRLTYYIEGTEPSHLCEDHPGTPSSEQEKQKKGIFDRFFNWIR
ncbi:PBP1A family penicillin-binding protein [Bacillus hwajinpoensis]|uniref:PBP1A family penicillin-binding protein n=1 Tax=Guptibacillus hwajinpoensis TaxID=208199 RepID=A0A845ERR6_9BACL|nr:transglycosylase domain-containing protein [Pseudalkalibacillus hwajinpoensis]MYL62409.1 PBP1A family penicillin-binding protein [Pseudalkalibacillus hwajinpoensis]